MPLMRWPAPRLRGGVSRLGNRVAALVIAATTLACDEPTAPLVPFSGETYDLVELDEQSLPAPFEFNGHSYLIGAATFDFISSDSLDFELRELTAISAGAPNILMIVGREAYRQSGRNRVEIGAMDFGVFRVSPWAYGERAGDALTLESVDPRPSESWVPDMATSPLGLHMWRFARRAEP